MGITNYKGYEELVRLVDVEEAKKKNFLWKTWKGKSVVTKFDVFRQFSYGHNKGQEFREYDAILRAEFGITVYVWDTDCSNPYLLICPRPNSDDPYHQQYLPRHIGRELVRLVEDYVDRVCVAYEALNIKYNKEISDIYPDINCFNFRKFLSPEDIKLVESYIFAGEDNANAEFKLL